MMHKRYLTVAVLSTLLLGGSAARSRGAEMNADLGPTTQIARRAEDVPFINGGLTIPSWKQTNNRGTILQQTVGGVTHMEAYLAKVVGVLTALAPLHGPTASCASTPQPSKRRSSATGRRGRTIDGEITTKTPRHKAVCPWCLRAWW